MRLGALEFTKVFPGQSAREILTETVTLASDLERWGYERLWLSEHHTPGVAHASPEVLMGIIAARTSTISVAAGGILMGTHHPVRVARAFLLLEALFPGRVDLGCARAGVAATALPAGNSDEGYGELVSRLLRCLANGNDSSVAPEAVPPPRVWLMGSGNKSAQVAGRLGLRYCHSAFLASTSWTETVSEYRRSFAPSIFCSTPCVGIAAAGVCASGDESAKRVVADYGVGVHARIVGTPDTCKNQVLEFCRAVDADEFLFLDMSTSTEMKRDSYKSLASAVLGM